MYVYIFKYVIHKLCVNIILILTINLWKIKILRISVYFFPKIIPSYSLLVKILS